jgi:hypothetical protein
VKKKRRDFKMVCEELFCLSWCLGVFVLDIGSLEVGF